MMAGMARWSGSRSGDLASVSVPTLVVAAGEDLLTPGGEAIADAIPSWSREPATRSHSKLPTR